MGSNARNRERARERRRRVYLFLLEAVGLTGLIGLFPPLRGMLVVTGFFGLLLLAYTALAFIMSRGGVSAAPRSEEGAAPPRNVVVLPEIQVTPNAALEEQDRRLVRLAR